MVGSFQRDTEGAGIKDGIYLPKLSKGPDILVKVIDKLKEKHPDLIVVLSGWRRQYVIQQLKKRNIPYIYYEMVTLSTLNQLYNCLDLYVVSSRTEGGPRAIVECAMAKVPIISTNVGIASQILAQSSLYDSNDLTTLEKCHPNVEHAYQTVQQLSTIKGGFEKIYDILTFNNLITNQLMTK